MQRVEFLEMLNLLVFTGSWFSYSFSSCLGCGDDNVVQTVGLKVSLLKKRIKKSNLDIENVKIGI